MAVGFIGKGKGGKVLAVGLSDDRPSTNSRKALIQQSLIYSEVEKTVFADQGVQPLVVGKQGETLYDLLLKGQTNAHGVGSLLADEAVVVATTIAQATS